MAAIFIKDDDLVAYEQVLQLSKRLLSSYVKGKPLIILDDLIYKFKREIRKLNKGDDDI